MVTETFQYEKTDLPDNQLRLDDIYRTYSAHKQTILAAFPTLDSRTYFVTVYLEGTYRITSDDHSSRNLSGRAIDIPFSPEWTGNFPATAKLIGDRAIEMSKGTEFYYVKKDTGEVIKAIFDEVDSPDKSKIRDLIKVQSSPNFAAELMHNTLI